MVMSANESRTYRPEKRAIVEEIRRRAADSSFVYLADFKGLTVARAAELRRRLRPLQARFQVVPNRLFLQAVRDLPTAALKPLLKGPTAIVTGSGDPVETARVLRDFAKEAQSGAAKGGWLEGATLSAADVAALAALPSKPQLQAMLVGTLAAPLRNVVGVLHQKLASLVYVLKAAEEKKGGAAAA